MRLFRIIPLLLILLAHSVQAGAWFHQDGACGMSCCEEFAGSDGCLCDAQEAPTGSTPALPPPSSRDLLFAMAWRGLVTVSPAENPGFLIPHFYNTLGEEPHFPLVGRPVLFCSFLI